MLTVVGLDGPSLLVTAVAAYVDISKYNSTLNMIRLIKRGKKPVY